MSTPIIKPQTLRGFRDFLPAMMIPRLQIIEAAREVYSQYGFSPIDTPALEYTEILLGKGGNETDKQLYRFEDQGGRDVAMRFDLTIPFARFAAQNIGVLGTPFKRYHIAPVWRGERPARGRFREFVQCDFDTIGTDSLAADIETILVVHDLLDKIGIGEFTIRINHRQLLNGLLEQLGLLEHSKELLRALDKLPKIGEEAVIKEMVDTTGVESGKAEQVLKLAALQGEPEAILEEARSLISSSELGQQAWSALQEITQTCSNIGIATNRLSLDLSIARGLDYYTGLIFETFLTDLPDMGSISSGGRYDDLAGLYTKQKLSGVGGSLGLDRLLAALDEMKRLDEVATTSQILVLRFVENRLADYQKISRQLHQAGIASEVYPEAKALSKQLKYADRKKIPLALISGEDELAENVWQLKNLRTGNQLTVSADHLAETVKAELNTL
ncbi:Histidine--tRNA ligase [Rubinisphaera italica]|uniref:Histidine--tRNA ligase n=1 Tax=Rubinisphaera italica TaxID=2527969 RepID=A0A5C5XIL3_9PLAN|nr:histidine--tRNA ligase [Rubinisphaera italica]TWT62614.1 Histidine--tRNA ligase [Rubinisphaera italica]